MSIQIKTSAIFAATALLLCCCTSREQTGNINTSIDPAMALPSSDDLGNLDLRIYEGILTDGSDYTLSVYNYRHSGDGLFSLEILSADNKLTISSGRLYTLRGTDDASVWECRSNDGKSSYFLLDTTGRRIFRVADDSDTTRCNPLSLIYSKIIR